MCPASIFLDDSYSKRSVSLNSFLSVATAAGQKMSLMCQKCITVSEGVCVFFSLFWLVALRRVPHQTLGVE